MRVQLLCQVQLFVTIGPRDFPGKNTGVGCHFPPLGNLLDPEIEPSSPVSPVLLAASLPSEPSGKPLSPYREESYLLLTVAFLSC